MPSFTANQDPVELSPYLHGLTGRYEDAYKAGQAGDTAAKYVNDVIESLALIEPATPETDVLKALRTAKNKIALALGIAEFTGTLSTKQCCALLSRYADAALQYALAYLLAGLLNRKLIAATDGSDWAKTLAVKTPIVTAELTKSFGFFILAMGKHGGEELNYSSDIDPIFLFDPTRVTSLGSKTIQELYQRLARNLVDLFERRTPDGYVFRVDLRLRPDPRSTPLAVSSLAAERYYQSKAQNWERAAFIKARFCAGDGSAANEFMAQIKPWLWRKTIDFVALDEMSSLKTQIEERANLEQSDGTINVKLGAGGIREIEFYAQIQQLLFGGRHSGLRVRRTDDALKALADQGFIEPLKVQTLIDLYYRLRRAEHAAQIYRDEQTHTLSTGTEKDTAIAALFGLDSAQNLITKLLDDMRDVRGIYKTLLADQVSHKAEAEEQRDKVRTAKNHEDMGLAKIIAGVGFKDRAAVNSILANWYSGRVRSVSSSAAQRYLHRCLPSLLDAFNTAPNPDEAFAKLDSFVESLPAGAQLFALFDANPKLLTLLARVMSLAPALADRLRQNPLLFASLLEPNFYETLEEGADLEALFDEYFTDAICQETGHDCARRANAELRFRAGIHLLEGLSAPSRVAKFLSDCADQITKRLVDRVKANFSKRHGSLPEGGLEIVALGRWGGQFLTFSSDLDLLFIYQPPKDETPTIMSDGNKPLTASVYYNRLAQRISSALSAPTTAGPLYDIDTRLRPSGAQGPLAVSLPAFLKYFAESAWTWEKLALTRARIVGLNTATISPLQEAITKALQPRTDAQTLLIDAAAMRKRLKDEFDKDRYWDVKHSAGGLVDIEFILQSLILKSTAAHGRYWCSKGSSDLVAMMDHLEKVGQLSERDRADLEESYRLQADLLILLRLSLDEVTPKKDELPQGVLSLVMRTLDFDSFDRLCARLTALRARTIAIADTVFATNNRLTE